MSMIQVRDLTTAQEVRENARRIEAARRASYLPKPVLVITREVEPEPEPKVELEVEFPVGSYALSDDEWALIRGLRAKTSEHPSFAQIMKLVAARYQVSSVNIRAMQRSIEYVMPRHIICYLAKTLTPASLPQIGRLMGGRDHTTVLSAVRKITRLRQTDPVLDNELTWLEGQLAQ